jgi:N-acyl-D-amino-acid deacylase
LRPDLLLAGATVVDGTGAPGRVADVAVLDGRIAAVGDLTALKPARVVDADELVLCPGFIDVHTHTDFTMPVFPRALSMTSQGVTTQLVGNCGFSPFPIGGDDGSSLREYSAFLDAGLPWGTWRTAEEYLSLLEALPLAVNIGCQVGHGSIRMAVMGFDSGAPSDAQLQQMQQLVAEAMDAGVFGLSSGLTYAPASAADTDELIALARVVARYDGAFYSTHIRSEATRLLEAVQEALQIGAEAGVPVQLSHVKAIGSGNWNKVARMMQLVEDAVERGQDVAMDQYPYTAGSTGLAVILPRWALAGGVSAMQARLADPNKRARIREQITAQRREDLEAGLREFDPSAIVIADVPEGPLERFIGMSVADIAQQRGEQPVDVALDLLEQTGGDVLTIVHGQSEDNLRRILQHPRTMVASDGWTLSPAAMGRPHPRSYGTYARVLGRYVREEHVLVMEEAIRKMTSLPARRLGLTARGEIRTGSFADLVLFDPSRISDRATFSSPHQFCEGVSMVIVNGQVVVEDGADTGATAGLVLRRGQAEL